MVAPRRNRRRLGTVSSNQPIVVATDWGARGIPPLALLFAGVAIAGFFYVSALARRQPPRLSAILLGCAAGLAIAWFAPVLFSSDVYAYAAYGEMSRLGLDPYVRAPVDLPDPLIRAAQAQWITAFPICVYGPGFVALARALVSLLAPWGVLAQLNAFRAIASAALLLCTLLAAAAYSGDAATRLRAATIVGLNPVALWCAAEGHNDALALALVLLGFVLARHRFVQVGAFVAALSALVKPPGALAALAFAVRNPRARIGAGAALALLAFACAPLVRGVATQVAARGHYAPQASLQAIFVPLGPLVAAAIAAMVAAALFVTGVRRLRAGSDEGWIWVAIAGWTMVPNPYPWYGLWLIATAALSPGSRAATVAILLSFTSLLRYVPDAIATPSAATALLLGLAAASPLAGLLPLRGWYNQQLA